MCSSVVCHTCFATCFFSDSVSVFTCCCILNFFESHSTVCSVFSCRNDFVTFFFFKFKLVFISFKFFTIQNFSSFDNFFCWSCFIGIGEGWVVTCNSCNKFSFPVICNFYLNFVFSSIVCHTFFTTRFFSDSVSVITCCFELNFFESNGAVCSVFSCRNDFFTFFKFEFVFISFKFFTVQDFLSCDSFFSWSCFISVSESWFCRCDSCC